MATTTLLTQLDGMPGAGDSANPRLSSDARYVVFDSTAAFDAKDNNGVRDIYRLDRQATRFELISLSADGRLGNGDSYQPQISANGTSVVFYTWANSLVAGDSNTYWDLILRQPASGSTQRLSVKATGEQ